METSRSEVDQLASPDFQESGANPRWRVQRVWLEDGLEELSGSVLALGGAGFWLLVRHNPLWFFAFVPAFMGTMWLYRRVHLALKARLADRRVGYVRQRPPAWTALPSHRRFWIGLVIALVLFRAIVRVLDLARWGVSADSLVMAAFLAFVVLQPAFYAWKTGHHRFYLYTIVPVPVVFAGYLAGADMLQILALWLIAFGLIALVAGGLALRAFLRDNPEVELSPADGLPN